MEIKIKYLAIASFVVIFLISGLIWYTTYLNDQIKQKENIIKINNQNEIAMQNKINMQADSLQDFALFVKDLQKNNKNLKDKYVLLQSKYTILIDSINVLNKHAEVDTTGNTIIVKFEGKEGKVSYKGHTTYFKLSGEGTYTIKIGVDPSHIESEIYLDNKTKLIRNKIYVDGALINDAQTNVDSTLYILIQNNSLEKPKGYGFFDRLHVTADLQQSIIKDGLIYKPYKFSLKLGTEYQFNIFRIYTNYDIINSEINVGVTYHPSLSQIWLYIF